MSLKIILLCFILQSSQKRRSDKPPAIRYASLYMLRNSNIKRRCVYTSCTGVPTFELVIHYME